MGRLKRKRCGRSQPEISEKDPVFFVDCEDPIGPHQGRVTAFIQHVVVWTACRQRWPWFVEKSMSIARTDLGLLYQYQYMSGGLSSSRRRHVYPFSSELCDRNSCFSNRKNAQSSHSIAHKLLSESRAGGDDVAA